MCDEDLMTEAEYWEEDDDCSVSCDLCASRWALDGNGEGIVLEGRRQVHGEPIRRQIKLCADCAAQCAVAVKQLFHEQDVCEHGVICGEWCEPCNEAYAAAAEENK